MDESTGSGAIDAGTTDDEFPAEAAFSVLANETRLAILRALWDAYDTHAPGGNATTFSDLYRAVDYGDAGNFSYHLDKLRDHFVAKTDEGYALNHAGLSLVQSVIAGESFDDTTLVPTVVDTPCQFCGASTTIGYEAGTTRFACTECEGAWESGVLGAVPFPPSGLDGRTPEDLADASVVWYLHRLESLIDGVCPVCAGRVECHVEVCPDHTPGDGRRCPSCARQYPIVFRHVCPTCKHVHRGPFRAAVGSHVAVASFYDDHDVDYRYPSFDALLRTHDYEETVLSEDPLRVQVTIPADDEELHLTLDETLSVVAVERTTRAEEV